MNSVHISFLFGIMEFVYTIERQDLFTLSFPQGFHTVSSLDRGMEPFLDRIREHAYFIERERVEGDSSRKQIIPYLLVTCGNDVFRVRRLPQQGEDRLHDLYSVGLGGHINPVDLEEGDPLIKGVERELNEEVHMNEEYTLRPAGIVNDDSNDVGAVHFGVVFEVAAGGSNVRVREEEKMEGEWIPAGEIQTHLDGEPQLYESWSRFLIREMDQVLAERD